MLRDEAVGIFREALWAVDAEAAVRRHARVEGDVLRVGDRRWDLTRFRRIRVFGAGKAFVPMARAVEGILGGRIADGMGITTDGQDLHSERIALRHAAHPVPDQRGLDATAEMVERLRDGRGDDLVIFLLSGGASALLEMLPEGVGLEDLQRLNELLLRSGAPIGDVNTVRKCVSRVKGGRLARIAAPAECVVLVVSDVMGNALGMIGSGPFVGGGVTGVEARAVLERYGIRGEVPQAAGRCLEGAAPEVFHQIVADNSTMLLAAQAAGTARGFDTGVRGARGDFDARTMARRMLDGMHRARGIYAAHPEFKRQRMCYVSGGEALVTVRGSGLGGRNTEMALAFAIEAAGLDGVVLLCGASDGRDGPTDAAGAVVDGGTVARGVARGLDAAASLDRNDSYTFLKAAGDLLITGPTGTNVNDLYLLLME